MGWRERAYEIGLDVLGPELVDIFVRQINQESGFQTGVSSSAGAQGIAQIVPWYHPDVDPWDPEASLQYAARLMKSHLDNYGGDVSKALAAYNAGPGGVQQAEQAGGANWRSALPNETKLYLSNILGGSSSLEGPSTLGAPPSPVAPATGAAIVRPSAGVAAQDQRSWSPLDNLLPSIMEGVELRDTAPERREKPERPSALQTLLERGLGRSIEQAPDRRRLALPGTHKRTKRRAAGDMRVALTGEGVEDLPLSRLSRQRDEGLDEWLDRISGRYQDASGTWRYVDFEESDFLRFTLRGYPEPTGAELLEEKLKEDEPSFLDRIKKGLQQVTPGERIPEHWARPPEVPGYSNLPANIQLKLATPLAWVGVMAQQEHIPGESHEDFAARSELAAEQFGWAVALGPAAEVGIMMSYPERAVGYTLLKYGGATGRSVEMFPEALGFQALMARQTLGYALLRYGGKPGRGLEAAPGHVVSGVARGAARAAELKADLMTRIANRNIRRDIERMMAYVRSEVGGVVMGPEDAREAVRPASRVIREEIYADAADQVTTGTEIFAEEIIEVPIERINFRPDLFQARDTPTGTAYNEGNVVRLLKKFRAEEFRPARAVPDPDNPGSYIVYRGHTRVEAAHRKGWTTVKLRVLADADISNPEHLAIIRRAAAVSNFNQARLSFLEEARHFQMAADTGNSVDEIAALSGVKVQEVQEKLDTLSLGPSVTQILEQDPDMIHAAVEIGWAVRTNKMAPADGVAWFMRLYNRSRTEGVTFSRNAVKDTIKKFGGYMKELPTEQFAGFEEMAPQKGHFLDLLDEYTDAVTKIDKARAWWKGTRTRVNKAAEQTGVTPTEFKKKLDQEILDAEARRKAVEKEVMAAYKRSIEEPVPRQPTTARGADPRKDKAFRSAIIEELPESRTTPIQNAKAVRVLHDPGNRDKLEIVARRYGYELEPMGADTTLVKTEGQGQLMGTGTGELPRRGPEMPRRSMSASERGGLESTEPTEVLRASQAEPVQSSVQASTPSEATRTMAPSTQEGPQLTRRAVFDELGIEPSLGPPAPRPILAQVDDIHQGRRIAQESQAELEAGLREVAPEFFYGSRVKNEAGLQRKIEEGRKAGQISDYLAARFIAPEDQWDDIIRGLHSRFGISKANDVSGPARQYGRPSMMTLDVKTRKGIHVEVQIVDGPTGTIQEFNHEWYEALREPGTSEEVVERAMAAIEYVATHAPEIRDVQVVMGIQRAGRGPEGRKAFEAAGGDLTMLDHAQAIFEGKQPIPQAKIPGLEVASRTTPWGEPVAVRRPRGAPTPTGEPRRKPGGVVEVPDSPSRHIDDAPPAPPGGAPPSSLGDAMGPEEPETPGGLLLRFLERVPGRKAGQADWAKFEGGLAAEGVEIDTWLNAGRTLVKSKKLKPGNKPHAWNDKVSKTLHGDLPVSGLSEDEKELYDVLIAAKKLHENRTKADVGTFERAMLPQYWPRGWRNPEIFDPEAVGEVAARGVRMGRLGPGQKPGTLRKRTLPRTYTEALEMGGIPVSYDPFEMMAVHAAELADYRYSWVLGELWKHESRALPRSQAPRSWITPDYPAFQSRPYVRQPKMLDDEGAEILRDYLGNMKEFDDDELRALGEFKNVRQAKKQLESGIEEPASQGFTEPLRVSPEDSELLKNILGDRPRDFVDAAAYITSVFRRFKVFGGFFQYFDLQNRTVGRAVARFVQTGDLSELNALSPAMRAWGAFFSPPPIRRKLFQALMDDPAIKLGLEEGLQISGGLDVWKRALVRSMEDDLAIRFPIIGDIPAERLPPGLKQAMMGTQKIANGVYKWFAGGLYDAAHPQYVGFFYKSLYRQLSEKYPEYSERQVAALAAEHTNIMMSAIPDWQSTLGPRLRQGGRAAFFSINEGEAWFRMLTRSLKGKDKDLYLAQWGGYLFTALAFTELINYAMTGEHLKLEQLMPFDRDEDGRPRYNTRFGRPQLDGEGLIGSKLGLKGPMGRHLYLDTMGQADTPFRFISPNYAAVTRLSPPFSEAMQQLQSKDFFSKNDIDTPGRRAAHAVEELTAPIPLGGFMEERGRIGWAGATIQGLGWNVSSESLWDLEVRVFEEETGKKWDETLRDERATLIRESERLSEIDAARVESSAQWGRSWAQAKLFFEELVNRPIDHEDGPGPRTLQRMATEAVQQGKMPRSQWREVYRTVKAEEAAMRKTAYAGVAFEDREDLPGDEAAEDYDTIPMVYFPDGRPDWDTFFAAQEAFLDAQPEEIREYILGRDRDDPIANQWRDAREKIKPYWKLSNKVWDYVVKQNPSLGKYKTAQAWEEALVAKEAEAGLPNGTLRRTDQYLKTYRSIVEDVRLQYRLERPELDLLLQLWFDYRPVGASLSSSTSKAGGLPKLPSLPGRR